MPAKRPITVTVNGEEYQQFVEPRRLLADFLRHDLGLTGTHVGCEHGVCGACTVLIDGSAVRSCLLLAVQAEGADVRTVEGLAASGRLHALQEAFRDRHALQCGFCTPGILMSACELLAISPDPSVDEIRDMLGGHLCRCTGYHVIVEAIRQAASGRDSTPQE
ncbi:MAG TPA: (2Fe-2S)-binding protein [Dehalococcoidia bacterium]|nr:(2Fe-2S)-binding protein [Dehalococcoidia bacterium]